MTKTSTEQAFGRAITRLLHREDFSREEMHTLFMRILNDEETEMQQGAFLAALAAKGETAAEIAAVWQAVYELDTVKVRPDLQTELVENSGTGMDAVKTFNISTAAAVAAAAAGVPMARHGARAITSACGTIDMVEALGVDVEVAPEVTLRSIETCGIGIFNGMSPLVHPRALSRILSRISFGSVLNTAASLANPANPGRGVRGVYDPAMVVPVAEIMRAIGYRRGLVVHGLQSDGTAGIDEAGTIGETVFAEIQTDGRIETGRFAPEDLHLKRVTPAEIASTNDRRQEALRLIAIFKGEREGADAEIVYLNTGLILYVAGKAPHLAAGVEQARELFAQGKPLEQMRRWVKQQSRDAEQGVRHFERLVALA